MLLVVPQFKHFKNTSQFALSLLFGASVASVVPVLAEAQSSPQNPTVAQYTVPGETSAPKKRIAVLGDSLVKDHWHSSNLLDSLNRIKTPRGADWAVDTTTPEIKSLFERLREHNPEQSLEIRNYSTVGAKLSVDNSFGGKMKASFGVKSIEEQIVELKSLAMKPDLILLFMGHNDLDWEDGLSADEKAQMSEVEKTKRHREKFLGSYRQRLTEIASLYRERSGVTTPRVLVLGLLNFNSFLVAREEAERMNQTNEMRFPELPATPSIMGVLKRERRQTILRVGNDLNAAIAELVTEINAEFSKSITFEFSDAISAIEMNDSKYLHPVDGLHLSKAGHDLFAEEVFEDLLKLEAQ